MLPSDRGWNDHQEAEFARYLSLGVPTKAARANPSGGLQIRPTEGHLSCDN